MRFKQSFQKFSPAHPMTGEQNIRQRIVLAAIESIEASGMAGVTVRQIAAAAEVNVAAISYYFGGKAELLDAALAQTLETGFSLDELDEAEAELGDLRRAVAWFLEDYLTNMQRWPGIAEAHLHAPLVEREYPEPVVSHFTSFVEGFLERVRPLLTAVDLAEARRAVVQLWSSVMFVGLLPGVFAGAGVDVSDEDQRKAYVVGLMDRYFPEAS